MKKFVSVCLSLILLATNLCIFTGAATFDDINASNVFVKQQTNYTCTLASAVMMLRRYAIIRGDSNWSNITESSIRSSAWLENEGLYHTFSINKTNGGTISVGHANIPSGDRTTVLRGILDNHPEGIVIYNRSYPHAVLLTDYTNGTFYCADPASGADDGRILLSKATGNVSLSTVSDYWYVTSSRVYLSDPTPNYNFDVNISADGEYCAYGHDNVTFDVYINGSQVRDDTHDFSGDYPKGTTYTVNDIKVSGDYVNTGSSSYSGTINDSVNVILYIMPTFEIDVNLIIDGVAYYAGHDEITFDVLIDGDRVADDVHDFRAAYAKGSKYEVNDIHVSSGFINTGEPSYSGTINDFTRVDIRTNTCTVFSDGSYRVKNKGTGKYLTAEGTYANTTNVIIKEEEEYAENQVWSFLLDTMGFKLHSYYNWQVLNAYGDYALDGDNITLLRFIAGDGAQRWKFEPMSDGYVIRSVMSPHNVVTVNGGNVELRAYEAGNNNQIWEIESYNMPGKPSFKNLSPYYESGDTITLEWDPTARTTHYNIWICKYNEETGVYDAQEWIQEAESGLTRTLNPGKYRLELQSYNSNYYFPDHSDWLYVQTNAYIIVCDSSAPRMWCEDINMPDEIPYGQPFSLSGRICSNNIVKWYALVIYNSDNEDIQNVNEAVWQVAIPNDYPITVAAEQLDFAALPIGSYRLSIQAMDKDNNYYGAYEKSFVVKCSQHSYVDTITPPTCTEQGFTTHTCSICGDLYIDSYVAASGHSYGAWTKLDETQHQRVCSRDASHVETAPHTWNAGTVTTMPTHDAAGEKTYTCTVCGATKPEVIPPLEQPTDPDAVITVASVKAQPGQAVDVTVDLTEYAPMSYLLLGLDYDTAALTLNSVKNGGLFDTLEKGANLLLNAGENIAAGGNLLTLTFTVSEDAEPGDYTVTVTCKQCYNNSEEPLLVKVENGKITVPDVIVGDVNDDEVIDGRDLIRLRKYLANLDEETGESTVEISAGADCTGDGIVDGRDLIRLRKYLANLDENTGISTVELG